MSAESRPLDAAAEQAIEWMSLLRSGEVEAGERDAFARWRQASPANDSAWLKLEAALRLTFDPVTARARRDEARGAREALIAAPRRRVLRGALAFAGIGTGSAWLLDRRVPLRGLVADLHTGTGERRRFLLDDGSEVTLNTRSAVDIDFDGAQRRLHLREGELIVSVARDAARPFVVTTQQGSVRALGTRFLVRQGCEDSRVLVLHSRVELRTNSGEVLQLGEGEGARFSRHRITAGVVPLSEAAWQDGVLEMHDRRLDEVIAELRRHRSGFIRVAADAAPLRVSGVYPLDDTDRALAALEQSLPIRMQRSPGWTLIERR